MEFFINVLFLILILSTQNLYLLAVFVTLFSKHIPEKILKGLAKTFKLKLGDRPSDAFNCSGINSGGKATESGFISGHVMGLSSLTFFLVFSFTLNSDYTTKQPSKNEIILLCILSVLTLLIAYARVKLHCHTKFQVLFGLFGGLAWGFLMFVICSKLADTYPRVKEDQNKLSCWLK
jgi:membrane-associated phospholipid phosphatase